MDDRSELAEDLAAIEAAARSAGIVPGDPGYPFIHGLTRVLDKFGQRLDAALKPLEHPPQQVQSEQLARATAYAMAQVLDKFGQRIEAALKPLEVASQQVPIEHLAGAAAPAEDNIVRRAERSRGRRALAWISIVWAFTMLVGMGATYWAGYSAGNSRRVLARCAAGQMHFDQQNRRHYCTVSEWVEWVD